MILNVLKNTVLLFVLVLVSCGSKSNEPKQTSNTLLSKIQVDKPINVGANRTDVYLPLLNEKRVGIVANQTSVIFTQINTSLSPRIDSYTHLVDSLVNLGVDIKKVFSPEHGFRGRADNGEVVKDGFDVKTGLPIISLYGKNKKPSKAQLEDLDIMIFDIQDVGVRFYTYTSAMHYMMEACAEQGIPMVIFDRPNPNGHYIDGPTLEIAHKSYLGMHPIPLVHAMTIGEYAQMINGEKWLDNKVQCDITIIEMKNYNHDTPYSLPIRPSPNLPNDQSIKLYPSLGLFEGTNINAGRGTEFQFQQYGATFLNKAKFEYTYTPKANFGSKYPKHKDELCYGENLENEDHSNGVTLKWLIKAYNGTSDQSLFFKTAGFTLHSGTEKLQQQIEAGLSEKEIKATWKDGLNKFRKVRSNYLLYN